MRHALIVSVMLIAAPVFGEQSTPTPPASARFGALRPAPANPYGQLFDVQNNLKRQLADAAPSDLRPKVVCGMLVIPADPNVDPKIAIPPNKAPNLEFKIRAIDPPMCKAGQ
jgi:hypothetical protein